ncbi:ECF RNA polymerase sigma factor SigG [Streptomyces sp. RB5]|uniref:RNA polymerase sigma factor n=1 Tax=Streptomyces smaragdinus TaxID=2585196 RepID=A0A7K0CP52_9ACTN|nr:ECF RNA polymerase sigma factor SigG [Streptomyces smaragdinus]
MEFETYRGELVAYCYRMLGSVHEAEDLVQETMLRAWKARERYDPARASVRTWLYRIATNACLTALDKDRRRPLPSGLGVPGGDTEAPLVPATDVPWLGPFPDARFDVEARADLRLAWVAAVQVLPARQRAVLILREVLAFSAAEVAEQLETTVAAVNSALQRARAALDGGADAHAVAEPDDPETQTVVQRYIQAFEAADVPALVRLLAHDAILEMPPIPLWFLGSRDYGRFMDRVYRMRGTGWRTQTLTSGGQPVLAAYASRPGGGYERHSVQVLTVTGGRITHNVTYVDPAVLDTFALPDEFPGS